jgi:hypothetical protein
VRPLTIFGLVRTILAGAAGEAHFHQGIVLGPTLMAIKLSLRGTGILLIIDLVTIAIAPSGATSSGQTLKGAEVNAWDLIHFLECGQGVNSIYVCVHVCVRERNG